MHLVILLADKVWEPKDRNNSTKSRQNPAVSSIAFVRTAALYFLPSVPKQKISLEKKTFFILWKRDYEGHLGAKNWADSTGIKKTRLCKRNWYMYKLLIFVNYWISNSIKRVNIVMSDGNLQTECGEFPRRQVLKRSKISRRFEASIFSELAMACWLTFDALKSLSTSNFLKINFFVEVMKVQCMTLSHEETKGIILHGWIEK